MVYFVLYSHDDASSSTFSDLSYLIFSSSSIFHWSGTFSSCHILLNSLVNSFTATSPFALYSSAGIPSIPGVLPVFIFFDASLTYGSLISVVAISLISSDSTSFSSIGFVGASLTSTSSEWLAHLPSPAFLPFFVSLFLLLTVATWCRLLFVKPLFLLSCSAFNFSVFHFVFQS